MAQLVENGQFKPRDPWFELWPGHFSPSWKVATNSIMLIRNITRFPNFNVISRKVFLIISNSTKYCITLQRKLNNLDNEFDDLGYTNLILIGKFSKIKIE